MSMKNTDTDFFGKQTDERILYVAKPHPLAASFKLMQIYLIAVVVLIVLVLLGSQISSVSGLFALAGLILAVLIAVVGTKIITDYQKREVAYITDRRLIRFEPTTLFATNARSLTWDEVVKIKTYPPNFIWKQLAIGNVVVHARTPGRPDNMGHGDVMADDIQISDVYFYRDLGNYIDKVLYLYTHDQKELESIHPFVAKPKGKRY